MPVKKLLVICLLLIYGASAMGATVHMHYCMDKLVGWSLWQPDKDDSCSKCGMKEKKGGCCEDEHKQLTLSADQQHSTFIAIEAQPFLGPALLPAAQPPFEVAYELRAPQIHWFGYIWPPPPKTPLYLAHGAVLI